MDTGRLGRLDDAPPRSRAELRRETMDEEVSEEKSRPAGGTDGRPPDQEGSEVETGHSMKQLACSGQIRTAKSTPSRS